MHCKDKKKRNLTLIQTNFKFGLEETTKTSATPADTNADTNDLLPLLIQCYQTKGLSRDKMLSLHDLDL